MSEEATYPEHQPTSRELAERNTKLAMQRTRLGAERTLMAWVRTSLSMISFGFTIYKFLQDMVKLETTKMSDRGPRNFGLALVGLGTAAVIVASIQYWKRMRELRDDSSGRAVFPLALFVAAAISLLGLLAFFSIVLQTGPF
jgi:putative membrane protein